jgi:tyrosine-protein kinase Etk/Wzc
MQTQDRSMMYPANMDFEKIWSIAVKNRLRLSMACLFGFLCSQVYYFLTTPVYKARAVVRVQQSSQPEFLLMKEALGGFSKGLSDQTKGEDELVMLKSHAVIESAVKRLRLYFEVKPKTFPVIGGRIYRSYSAEDTTRGACLGLTSYAWGGEQCDVSLLEIPDSWNGIPFTIEKTGDTSYKLQWKPEKQSEALTLHGNIGQVVEQTYPAGTVRIQIHQLSGHIGVQFQVTTKQIGAIVAGLRSRFEHKIYEKNASFYEIGFQHHNPVLALRILSETLKSHAIKNSEMQAAQIQKVLDYIHGSLPKIEKRVDATELQFNDFRKKEKSIKLEKQMELILGEFVKIQSRISELYQKKADLLQQLTPRHQSVQSIDLQIEYLQKELKDVEGRALQLPDLEFGFSRLERNVRIQAELYLDLLKKAQEMELMRVSSAGVFFVIEQPTLPTQPVWPNRFIISVAGALMGLLLGGVVIVGYSALRKNLSNLRDLESNFDVPVLVSIYKIPLHVLEKTSTPILVQSHPGEMVSENIRNLRTSVYFASLKAANRRVMITGATPGIGKSFVSVNLAYVFAESGKKTLLIDADVRKGAVSQYLDRFSLHAHGLSDLLSMNRDDKWNIQSTFPNLDVLRSGTKTMHQANLLLDQALKEFLEYVTPLYDYIFIDTPPLIPLSDSVIIGQLCGVNLFVVREDTNTVSEVRQSLQMLESHGVNVTGFVFNDSAPTNSYTTYYDQYNTGAYGASYGSAI